MSDTRPPVIAIVGRPNVGKSTLFNRLTHSRDALVDDQPGVTRDRISGSARHASRRFHVIDTGGLEQQASDELALRSREQVSAAVRDSDAVVFLTDARDGVTAGDHAIAQWLRRLDANIYLAVNKTEGRSTEMMVAELHELGAGGGTLFGISAKQGKGVADLLDAVLSACPPADDAGTAEKEGPLNVGVVGRPNVGKSTLVNRLLGDERLLVLDEPGTTRDRVKIAWRYAGESYCLVDTAGVRRRSRVHERIEKYSIVKTLATIEEAHVVVLVLDARQGVAEQDARLAGMIRDSGRAMVLAINKWDGLENAEKSQVRRGLRRKLPFIDDVAVLYISARHGTNVGLLMPAIKKAAASAMAVLNTPRLNRVLQRAVEHQSPPMVGQRHIKLKYAHQGGSNPPTVIVHGNLVDRIPASYRRYLCNQIRREFGLQGTPLELIMKTADNPYSARRGKQAAAAKR